jgi:hypothetical protein
MCRSVQIRRYSSTKFFISEIEESESEEMRQSGAQSPCRISYGKNRNSDVLLGIDPYSSLRYEGFSVK